MEKIIIELNKSICKIIFIFYFLFYFLISIILLPIFLIIDLLFNINRKDLTFFIYSRYIFPLKLIFKKLNKNISKNNNIFIFATSAGELKTISNSINKVNLYTKYNIIFFYTSLTAKEYSQEINFINQNFYLFPDNFLYNLIFFFKFKPKKIYFFESEIWPGILIFSKIFKATSFFLQAKLPDNIILSFLYLFLILILFDFIIPQDKLEEEKIIKLTNFLKRNKKINSYNFFNTKILESFNFKLSINFNKTNPYFLESIFNNKINLITFASTHAIDEPIFFEFINIFLSMDSFSKYKINHYENSYRNIFVIVPRHPQRANEINNALNKFFKSKNSNFTNIKNLSELKNFLNLVENIFINENNIDKYQDSKINYYNILNKAIQEIDQQNLIIICDKFNILKNILAITKITFLGATFFWHGGGHNIIEPLIYNNLLICGPYLLNLKDIFEEVSIKFGKSLIFTPPDATKFIQKKYLKKKINYNKNIIYINNYDDFINLILNYLLNINKNNMSFNNLYTYFENLDKKNFDKLIKIFDL
ncbi:MAG: hypothetical protein N3A58_05295 [Spirochaetes bacterium]|nr:hypothetical protein [Spirochaetota bacterium]